MATRNEIGGLPVRAVKYLTRTVICLFGLAAIVWGALTFPLFWQQAVPKSVVAKLLQGQTFKTQRLLAEAEQAEAAQGRSFCNPAALHNIVVLRLAIFDGAVAATNHALADSSYDPLYGAARRALSCAPADPFVWLTLFWLDVSKHGLGPDNLNYLRLSYTSGPNEGWVALWRNRLALELFDRLPNDLSDETVEEFVKLVDTGEVYPQTEAIFANAGPAVQSRIVEHLRTAKAIPRQIFAMGLYNRGVDVNIPDVERPGARPWR
jgi:hypothetical protein